MDAKKISEQIARLSEYQYRQGFVDAIEMFGKEKYKLKAKRFYNDGERQSFKEKTRHKSTVKKGVRGILQDVTALNLPDMRELRFLIYEYLKRR